MKMGDDLLFFQEVDELNITKLAKVPLQSLLTEGFEVLDVSNVDVPRRAGVDGECESGRKWARVLAPTDLQPAVVEGQTLERSDLVERHGGGWVDERYELSESLLEWSSRIKDEGRTYRNMLILHVPDALQHTSPDGVAQVLGGGLGVDVAEVDGPVQRLVSVQATEAVHTVHTIHSSEIRREGQVGGHRRPEVALTLEGREGSLSDEGLGCGCLSGLCSGLLRLWNVGASILAVVDALPCPRRFRRERIDNLQ